MTAKEAAKMLGVTLSALQMMVRKGMIQPLHEHKRASIASFFSLSEIAALADIRFQKLDMPTIATMAMRALALSRNSAKKLDHVCNLLGLNTQPLDTTEAGVIARYIEAQDLLTESPELSSEEVRRWANIFYAVDEAYLRLVAHYTSAEAPWEPFLNLAQKLCETAPVKRFAFHTELASAYGFLEAGRRHLRTVVYFYLRGQKGPRIANAAFLEMDKSIDAEIAALIYKPQP